MQNSFNCLKCSKCYISKSKLNEHVKNCHPEDETCLVCKHCQKKYSSIISCKKHEEICAKRKSIPTFDIVEINSTINSTTFRHQYHKSILLPDGEILKFIDKLQSSFNNPPSTIHSFINRTIAPATIKSYTSNVNHFGSWLENNNKNGEDFIKLILSSTCLVIKEELFFKKFEN
jgi:hypothetical protein